MSQYLLPLVLTLCEKPFVKQPVLAMNIIDHQEVGKKLDTSGQIALFDPQGPERFFNRELSWLAFNRRVLEEAENKNHPLLEQLRFLSISANNLDEFYTVRVAGLRGLINAHIDTLSQDGLTAEQQLEQVHAQANALMDDQQVIWQKLRQQLREKKIAVLEPDELTVEETTWLSDLFLQEIFPVLTPLAIDPAHPFPFIPNRGLAIALELRRIADGQQMQALLPIPSQVSRFVRLPDSGDGEIRFIAL